VAIMQGIRRRQRSGRNAFGETPSAAGEHHRGRRTPEVARQEIIDVARAYISKRGFKDLTVEKLMRDTEIGRSAFYVYFASVNELAALFVHELSTKIEAAAAGWYRDEGDTILRIREALRSGIEFWEVNGPMIRALEEASWHDDRLRGAFRDEIGLRPIKQTTEVIERDQAKGLIGPMDAREMAAALNRFNLTYLNDRFGNPRRKSKPTDKEKALEVLERVWTATLFGKVAGPKGRRRGAAPPRVRRIRRSEGDGAGKRESAPDGRRESPRPSPRR
jgi:TetR/AcrR family transcriptional regulator, ethionamide resistance regulator